MSHEHSGQAPHLSCSECQPMLQAYLDDGLTRQDAMRIYLHVRECEACTEALGQIETLIDRLESMPAREAPADMDAAILASVPYESYRAMASLRAPRVPVFLAAESLPAWVRQPVVRGLGALVAAAGLAAWLGLGGDDRFALAAVGLVPELLVRLQTAGRMVAQMRTASREEV